MTPSWKESCSKGKNIETDQDVPCYFFLHVSCVGASCSSVLQVSKIKTSCWSYERSIKVNVPQEIGRGTKSLRCPGPLSYLYIPCELVSSWRWFCYPGLQLSVLFPSRWQSMQIKDIGSKSRTHCFQPWPIQGSGHGLWCTSRYDHVWITDASSFSSASRVSRHSSLKVWEQTL